jgi:hypothetical protein
MKNSNRIALGIRPASAVHQRAKVTMKAMLQFAVRFLLINSLLLFCRFGAGQALAQPAAPKPAASKSGIKFLPKTTGMASVRVTGGSRGSGEAAVTLDVLAPDDVGTTTQEQPSLFWFQSKPDDNAKFELTLLQEKKAKPVVQVKMDHASKSGIQRLKLTDHGVKLTPGVEYQWVVALITDPENRSTDLVASGVIKRVQPSTELMQKLSGATAASRAAIYADAGVWYDALGTLSDQIESQPGDKSLHETRAELLRQVGLNAAAQTDVSR